MQEDRYASELDRNEEEVVGNGSSFHTRSTGAADIASEQELEMYRTAESSPEHANVWPMNTISSHWKRLWKKPTENRKGKQPMRRSDLRNAPEATDNDHFQPEAVRGVDRVNEMV